jgi:quinol monooxygenase YgiN
MFYVTWKSKEALEKHLEMRYLKAFVMKADNLPAKPIEITLLDVLS